MDKNRWQKISDLALDLLEIPERERLALLEESCLLPDGRQDRDMIEEILSLVTESQEARQASFFSSPFAGVASVAAEELDLGSTKINQRQVASWTIVDILGSGGMGVVYHAERVDKSFNQQAALKLVLPGFGADFRQRFIQERALLAQLNHPGIARLLDGGIDEYDRPYLAMELVEGVPITDYCDSSELSIHQSIKLFIQACEALAYAHINLVVHQDIKPSHLLVEVTTGKPQVKLLDFGIAQIASSEEGLTQDGFGMLTPAYASPEQLAKKAITTSTDVYSLGVILYELLTGERPYETKNLKVNEVRDLLSETRPTDPSDRVLEIQQSKRLKGDLDAIVSKALSHDPEDRYHSAQALGDDLQNYLRDLPVKARTHDFPYLAKKFTQRNRSNVIATVLTFILLSSIVGVFLNQLTSERNKAQIAAVEAEEKARQKEAIAGFLEGILRAPNEKWYNQFQTSGADVSVVEVLNIVSWQIDSLFADEPEIAADLHHIVGDTYGSLPISKENRGAFHHRRVLELREELYESPHPKIAEAYYYLAATQGGKGQYADRARNLFKSYKMLKEKDGGNNFPFIAQELSNVALSVNRLDLAEFFAREARQYVETVFVRGHDGYKYRDHVLDDIYVIFIPIALRLKDEDWTRELLKEGQESLESPLRMGRNKRWRLNKLHEGELEFMLGNLEKVEPLLLSSMNLPGGEKNPYEEDGRLKDDQYLLDKVHLKLWVEFYTAMNRPEKVAIYAADYDALMIAEESMAKGYKSSGLFEGSIEEILQ